MQRSGTLRNWRSQFPVPQAPPPSGEEGRLAGLGTGTYIYIYIYIYNPYMIIHGPHIITYIPRMTIDDPIQMVFCFKVQSYVYGGVFACKLSNRRCFS